MYIEESGSIFLCSALSSRENKGKLHFAPLKGRGSKRRAERLYILNENPSSIYFGRGVRYS